MKESNAEKIIDTHFFDTNGFSDRREEGLERCLR
jgi:hypothetical protein